MNQPAPPDALSRCSARRYSSRRARRTTASLARAYSGRPFQRPGSISAERSRSRPNCASSSRANSREETHSVTSSCSWKERLSKFTEPTEDQAPSIVSVLAWIIVGQNS